MKKLFLVLATPRTGSTLLVNCLKPYCAGEIWYKLEVQKVGWTFEESRKNPEKYLRHMTKNKIAGGKLHTVQLDQMALLGTGYKELFSALHSAVFLRRRNLTDQAISHSTAEKIGWHNPRARDGDVSLVLDVDRLKVKAEDWFNGYQCWVERAQSGCKVMSLWYEDLEADILGVTNNVRQFVGLPEVKTINHGMTKLRSPERYRRIIANYDQIVNEMGKIYGVPFGNPGNRWNP